MTTRTGARWAVPVLGDEILLRIEGDDRRLPTPAEVEEAFGDEVLRSARVTTPVHTLGQESVAIALPEDGDPPPGFAPLGLRHAYHVLSEQEFRAAGTAKQKVEWLRNHAFCSRCGSGTVHGDRHEALTCPECGQHHFARIAPAVIVLIQRGDEALLARSPHFPAGLYSTVAGFVEPGESLEECVHREIEEEVGVQVENLRYFGSQPHPFPHSLMIGFVVDWRSGEIRVDPEEIEDAQWFHRDVLPDLPHPMSIARALILDFVNRSGG